MLCLHKKSTDDFGLAYVGVSGSGPVQSIGGINGYIHQYIGIHIYIYICIDFDLHLNLWSTLSSESILPRSRTVVAISSGT